MVNTTVNERIKEIIDTVFKGNITSMAKASFVSRTTLSSIVAGKMVTPGYDVIRRIGEMSSPRISLEWLVSGEGNMIKPKGAIKCEGLPLLPYNAMAGALSGSSLSTMEYECEHYVIPAFNNADFLVRVQGDSMTPRYYSGDIVACKKVSMNKLFFQWGKTYVLSTSQGVLIKRVDPGKENDSVSIVSYNKEYQTFQLPMEDINREGLALVVGLLRIE